MVGIRYIITGMKSERKEENVAENVESTNRRPLSGASITTAGCLVIYARKCGTIICVHCHHFCVMQSAAFLLRLSATKCYLNYNN